LPELLDHNGRPLAASTSAGGRALVVKQAEGAYRPGPWYLPVTGGWLPADVGNAWNWWQNGHDPIMPGTSAMVEACVGAYSQTVAMCPGDHWRQPEGEGRKRVTTSALSRILRRPNDYESISDFLLNLTRDLYTDGNAYALGLRNDRGEIDQLHLFQANMCKARVASTGDIFYALAGNEIVERRIATETGTTQALRAVPARDVLHVRLHTPLHPLVGETPIMAAALDVATQNAAVAQQLAFFARQSRPSFVVETDEDLTQDQIDGTRELLKSLSVGLNAGGIPFFTHGLKAKVLPTSARDAALAETMKMTRENIGLCYRVPLQILGIGGAPFSSVEALNQLWLAGGLGFALNHIEEAFGALFGLAGYPLDYVEFNTAALLRSAFKDRIDALARGVQGAIFAPNEARDFEGLPPVKFGDQPRVQQQVVPLSYGANLQPPTPKPATPAPQSTPAANGGNDSDEQSAIAPPFDESSFRQLAGLV
jgi:HK97 family phage portal protein